MRRARLHLPAWLALVAMLLLAALPTAGRLFGDAHASAALHAAMGHAQAPAGAAAGTHGHHGHAAQDADHGRDSDAGHAPTRPLPSDEPDCEYCPLYSGLLNTLAVPPLPAGHRAQPPEVVRALAVHHAAAPVPALGAQAPPCRS